MARKSIDCREYPSEKKCTLKLSGEEDELLEAAIQHAVKVHGEEDSTELRSQIKAAFKDETSEQPINRQVA